MATFQELMRAAENADRAGDTAAARELVQMAQKVAPPAPRETGPVDIGGGIVMPRAEVGNASRATPRIDRFGDTIAAATEGPKAATAAFARGVVDPSQSPTRQAIDDSAPDWVPDAVRGPAAMAGDVAMTGLSGLGTAYAYGAGAVGEALGGSPTNEKKLARDLMMMGEVAVPELAGVSSASLVSRGAARASRKLGKPSTPVQQTARAADELGITPSLGAGGMFRAQAAAALEKVPGTGEVIGRDAARFVDEIEGAFQKARAGIGEGRSVEGAGEALQAGLSKFVLDFEGKSRKLYRDVGKHIPPGTLVPLPETRGYILDALKPFENHPQIRAKLGLDEWAKIASEMDQGLPWEAAAQLRTDIGASIGKIRGPLADMDEGRLKRLYGKLAEDMEFAARASGPDAEKAWRRANNYYSRGATRISDHLDKTISADSPERAFVAFQNMAKEGRASSDAKRMFTIKASMPRDEWNEVAATIVDRMGRATSGQQNAAGDVFSPGKFLTEWNNLSPEAKSVLLNKNTRNELDKLAQVAEGAKRAGAERNFSNTGTVGAWIATVFGASASPVATAATLGGINISARALTSQRFLMAANRAARGDMRAMRAIAASRNPLAMDAQTVLRISAAEAAQVSGAANISGEPFRDAK